MNKRSQDYFNELALYKEALYKDMADQIDREILDKIYNAIELKAILESDEDMPEWAIEYMAERL